MFPYFGSLITEDGDCMMVWNSVVVMVIMVIVRSVVELKRTRTLFQ